MKSDKLYYCFIDEQGNYRVTFTEAYAKTFVNYFPNDTIKIYDGLILIDECIASDCFNIKPNANEQI